MRIANVDGRLALVTAKGVLDVGAATAGGLPSDAQAAYGHWDELLEWAQTAEGEMQPLDETRLGPPAPQPRQVLAIGLNYAGHAAEAGVATPEAPSVFTKFPTSIGSPCAAVALPSEHVDWEIELVAVIGRRAYRVSEERAWSHVAGLTVGQDLSERKVQNRPPAPQFSLGKSFPGFGPIGPVLVTPDEFEDPDDLAISCTLNGTEVQRARTSDLVFSVPALISRLSAVLPLLPGDLIFTGTPAGVGLSRNPPQFLRPGDELLSTIEGIGTLRTRLVTGGNRGSGEDIDSGR
jgi:2-keto-4-pentenoate hydratase/2-oxohepta-3-ene-1,7-dioic acid hydratase in catechol pathway